MKAKSQPQTTKGLPYLQKYHCNTTRYNVYQTKLEDNSAKQVHTNAQGKRLGFIAA